ncbi:hypothetical protein ABDB91_03615 [Desulfoscipio sp. XC116]|uniref:hypothetical protein n=1 Tax=Desulfoscipio sp. XC116 TaxID=3144975 RepID=UPI00325ACCDA
MQSNQKNIPDLATYLRRQAQTMQRTIDAKLNPAVAGQNPLLGGQEWQQGLFKKANG